MRLIEGFYIDHDVTISEELHLSTNPVRVFESPVVLPFDNTEFVKEAYTL
jgi:hypothetical protein